MYLLTKASHYLLYVNAFPFEFSQVSPVNIMRISSVTKKTQQKKSKLLPLIIQNTYMKRSSTSSAASFEKKEIWVSLLIAEFHTTPFRKLCFVRLFTYLLNENQFE